MTLTSPDPAHHLDLLADVFARTFSDYWQRTAYVTEGYIAESTYDWHASRIGIVDDEVATHFGVWDFGMRIGRSVVRVAGIGAVATLKNHRGKGLMAETAAACVDDLGAEGYDLSLLFGIPNFYHRFGYVVASSDTKVVLQTREIAASVSPVEYALYDGPVVDLADLYNAENEGVTGTYVRPTYRRNRRQNRYSVYRFDGGYVVGGREGEAFVVADCAADPAAVVEVARQRAIAEICAEIEFGYVPPRSRTGEYLQTLTHRSVSDRHQTGGPMLKVINLQSTLEKLAPELTARIAASPMHGYSGTLAIYGEGVGFVLGISGGEVGDVTAAGPGATANGTIVAGNALGRLLIGDGDPARICRQSAIDVSGDAIHLLPILFPDQEPSTILWDRF